MGHALSFCKNSGEAMSVEQKRSLEWDNEIERDRQKAALDFKILILGAGESGKSTVVKQLRNIHKGQASMSAEEIQSYKAVLHTNTVQSMRILLCACETFEMELDEELQQAANVVEEHDENELMNVEHASCIEQLWTSEEIQQAYERRHEIYFPDAAPYYFQNVFRFVEDGYVPSEEDIVMARIRTTGMFMTAFEAPPVHWRVVDVGGQRSERKKWIKFFDDVQAILFVVNLAGYNQVLFEDQEKNRMVEALELFEKIAKTPCFLSTPIFLFFNKKDLFEENLRQHNITSCFPDYEGSMENTQEALDFISEEFKKRMPDQKEGGVKEVAGVHFIAARYKKDVKYSFEDIKEFLINHNQKKINKAVKSIDKK